MSAPSNTCNLRSASGNAAFYNRHWKIRGRNLHYTELMRAKFISEALRDFVGPGEHEILDLGCGRGWMSQFISPFGNVTGVDFSPDGIQFAKDNYGAYGEFHLANPETLGLPVDRRFDVVVSSEVIEHVEDPVQYVRQAKRFLKARGWLLMTTPNGLAWPEFEKARLFVHALQPVENWLKPSRLSQILRAEGFEILLHEGRPTYEFRSGRHRWLQRRCVHRLFEMLGMEHKYGRRILMDAFTQVLVARLSE